MDTAIQSQPICTVLVPGWLDNDRTLTRLRTFLELNGVHAVICSPQPSDGSAPIERLAEQLADRHMLAGVIPVVVGGAQQQVAQGTPELATGEA